jgi:hypothetical protein
LNPYAYVGDAPITNRDPLGLFVVKNCGQMTGAVTQAANDVLATLDNCLGCTPQRTKVRAALASATIQCGGLNDNTLCGESDGRSIYLNPVVVNNVRMWGNRGRGAFGFPDQTCDCLPGLILHEAAHNAFNLGQEGEDLARRIARKCFSCAR